jgi:BMFP domain-containing protein YqiC
VDQYKIEERSIVAKRIISSGTRIKRLISSVKIDEISLPENVELLKGELQDFTHDVEFKKCKNMGEVLATALDFVKRNYEDVSMKQIIEKKF